MDYIVCRSTLLGVVRHGGLIPWDDDIDLHVHKHDLPKVIARIEADPVFCTAESNVGPKFFRCDSTIILGKSWGYPFLDIFREVRQIVFPHPFKNVTMWPSKPAMLENVPVRIPNDAQGLLENAYGENYMTECVPRLWDHKRETYTGFSVKPVPCSEVRRLCQH